MEYSKPFSTLLEYLQKLPGVGPKSAGRMAFYLLKMPEAQVRKFADALIYAKENLHYCSTCFNICASDPCEICSAKNRDNSTICVISQTKDLMAIEKTNEFKGLYHVLQGVISPMDGVGPDDIRLKELLTRVSDPIVKEVILALSPSVEGETTALYLNKLIKPFNVKVTRIAFGIPIGSDLEYADEPTLIRALEGRHEI